VIDKLQQRSWRFKELMVETEIPEKTLWRILKELEFYGLAVKKADGAWGWYLCKRTFSPRDYELMIEHSMHVIFGARTRARFGERDAQDIAHTSAYALLRSYDKGALERDFPEFAGHLKTGYQDLFAFFEKWKKMPEVGKVTHFDGGLEPDEAEQEAVENILRQVGGELAVIITKVRNGIPLEGYCDFCPHKHLTIKE